MQLDIFNRYGQRVFSNSSYGQPWAGTATNGKPLPVGTYYYVIELKDTGKRLSGAVTILR